MIENWFQWSNLVAMLGWFILIFFSRKVRWLLFIPKYLIPMLLIFLYSGLVLTTFFTAEGNFSSIDELRLLFANDHILLAGWLHYLCFDLFIGVWIAQRADAIEMSRLIQAPILLTTFLLGPLGLGLFFLTQFLLQQFNQIKNSKASVEG